MLRVDLSDRLFYLVNLKFEKEEYFIFYIIKAQVLKLPTGSDEDDNKDAAEVAAKFFGLRNCHVMKRHCMYDCTASTVIGASQERQQQKQGELRNVLIGGELNGAAVRQKERVMLR